MICVAALIVFAILAVFSAKYRPLAKEAFSCVFLKVRRRPCQSGLDRRVRMAAMMPFMKRTPKLAKLIHKYFSVLSTVFVILTMASLAWIAWGGYNYALYGNCNGPGSSGFCVFDPSGPGASDTGECSEIEHAPEALIKPLEENLTGFKTFNEDAEFTVIFFGCYSCEYTRKAAEPLFEVIDERSDVRFVLVDFPILRHELSEAAADAANCVYDLNRSDYAAYAQELYRVNLSAGIPGYDDPAFAACIGERHPRTLRGTALGIQTGVYGTPTYFIGDKPVVGPLNKRALEKLIKDEMKKR